VSDECIHGMNPDWCSQCQGHEAPATSRTGDYGYYGGQTKQDLLNRLCDQLGLPREPIGEGSSLPSHVFDAAAAKYGVGARSMPEIGEAITRKAGLAWAPDCDSRGSVSGGGSTVTREGLDVLNRAIATLNAREI
jgi:hypothetical protein